MKLHIGCGTVYLRGWTNIDIPTAHTFLAHERPDLVQRYITDDTDYYGRHKDKTQQILREGAVNKEVVCDAYGALESIPCANGRAEAIRVIQVLEHLSMAELDRGLAEAARVLEEGGEFTYSIPDFEETLALYVKTQDPFYKRHLFGPRTSAWGFHIPYGKDDFDDLFAKHSFEFLAEGENFHNYPAIVRHYRLSKYRGPG